LWLLDGWFFDDSIRAGPRTSRPRVRGEERDDQWHRAGQGRQGRFRRDGWRDPSLARVGRVVVAALAAGRIGPIAAAALMPENNGAANQATEDPQACPARAGPRQSPSVRRAAV